MLVTEQSQKIIYSWEGLKNEEIKKHFCSVDGCNNDGINSTGK